MRTFVAVAQRGSFSRAADELHIAQQAVSQQIAALERSLGVRLLHRNARRVELTPEGAVFLADCRRAISAADRAVRRVKAAARGEVGSIRLAYTLTTAFETVPELLGRVGSEHPEVKVDSREVFGGDIADLLLAERSDVALAPATSYPRGFRRQTVRREPMKLGVSDSDPLARAEHVELATVADRSFETWPREMAPGFYDTVVSACRAAGFEPDLDEHATGNAVWGYIARGRGVCLINGSVTMQLPRGIALVDVVEPATTITYDAVWRADCVTPVLQRLLRVAGQLSKESRWS
jgi:DNA-binding transcriptional LysR family regulator